MIEGRRAVVANSWVKDSEEWVGSKYLEKPEFEAEAWDASKGAGGLDARVSRIHRMLFSQFSNSVRPIRSGFMSRSRNLI